jgi:hypothetical protein
MPEKLASVWSRVVAEHLRPPPIETLPAWVERVVRRLALELSSPRVVAVFERAEPGSALGGTSPSWGDALSDYQQTAEGFIASLRNDGCFDAVLPYTARLPFRTKLAVSVTAITATETTEADEKPVLDLAFTATELEPRKASATVVISTELARMGGDNANTLILRELRNGVICWHRLRVGRCADRSNNPDPKLPDRSNNPDPKLRRRAH